MPAERLRRSYQENDLNRSIITLTTDFGTDSPYVAQMKGAILTLNPQATVVDVTHAIPPQDVHAGSLALEQVVAYFPAGTIHIAVVDPGVGTRRPLVYAKLSDQHFLAPDNGLLTHVIQRQSATQVIRLQEPQYWRASVSATFHGRDILAPVAAHLSLGLEPHRLGPPHAGLVALDLPQPQRVADGIEGSVIGIDSFGNLLTNIPAESLHDRERSACKVLCRERVIDGIVHTYGYASPGTLVALIGSHGALEIAVVRGNAASELSAHVGDEVAVLYSAADTSALD